MSEHEPQHAYDVAAVRAGFSALQHGVAHFDSPGGTQTPDAVADAIADVLKAPLSNRGTLTRAARNADEVVHACRGALGDLLAVDPATVVFGRSTTALTFDLSRVVSASWRPGDEVVLTGLDHDANVRPWVYAAERAGAVVRWADPDPETAELPVERVAAQLSERTVLVAVTAASTSTPARPTSSSVPTAASSRAARRCSRRCARTSCCRRPTPCPSASSSARCPTS